MTEPCLRDRVLYQTQLVDISCRQCSVHVFRLDVGHPEMDTAYRVFHDLGHNCRR
jgi:hypothetical protein